MLPKRMHAHKANLLSEILHELGHILVERSRNRLRRASAQAKRIKSRQQRTLQFCWGFRATPHIDC